MAFTTLVTPEQLRAIEQNYINTHAVDLRGALSGASKLAGVVDEYNAKQARKKEIDQYIEGVKANVADFSKKYNGDLVDSLRLDYINNGGSNQLASYFARVDEQERARQNAEAIAHAEAIAKATEQQKAEEEQKASEALSVKNKVSGLSAQIGGLKTQGYTDPNVFQREQVSINTGIAELENAGYINEAKALREQMEGVAMSVKPPKRPKGKTDADYKAEFDALSPRQKASYKNDWNEYKKAKKGGK